MSLYDWNDIPDYITHLAREANANYLIGFTSEPRKGNGEHHGSWHGQCAFRTDNLPNYEIKTMVDWSVSLEARPLSLIKNVSAKNLRLIEFTIRRLDSREQSIYEIVVEETGDLSENEIIKGAFNKIVNIYSLDLVNYHNQVQYHNEFLSYYDTSEIKLHAEFDNCNIKNITSETFDITAKPKFVDVLINGKTYTIPADGVNNIISQAVNHKVK